MQMYNMSERQYKRLEERIIKRHLNEDWIIKYLDSNGEWVTYLKLELVEWLKDVYFNKSKNVIGVAVNRMEKSTIKSYKYTANGIVMISGEGIKWLAEKYFRKQYLKDLEIYKLLLQNVKRKQNGFDELLIV